jgi:hypothetical protein
MPLVPCSRTAGILYPLASLCNGTISALCEILLGRLAEDGCEAGGFVPVAEEAKAEVPQGAAEFFQAVSFDGTG